MKELDDAYARAQRAMADLKGAVRTVLCLAPEEGLRNAEIGRSLGIYMGHVEHEGHVSRTILAILEQEGVVEQDDDSKKWKLRSHF